MAAVNYTVTSDQQGIKTTVTWANVTQADTCIAYDFTGRPADNITVEADDTAAWGGATLAMVGNNGGPGKACTSMDNTTVSWAANALFSIRQRPSAITPVFTGGLAQSVTVYMTIWAR